ncbi:MAG: DUF4838 domain-containing protein [Anaerolineaceae bacterium]
MALTALALSSWSLPSGLPPGPQSSAVRELELHLDLLKTPAGSADGELEVVAGDGAGDGFSVELGANRVTLRGDNPRGCLNAAYWLLEQLGFCWVAPGPDGIRFVPGKQLAEGSYREEPRFRRRTLILGNDALHDDWPEWFEWASRNRLNDIFFHDTPPSRLDRGQSPRPSSAADLAADRSGWMLERWDADSAAIRAAASVAGMSIQFGGHHLPALLSRELFATNPEWFPMRDGVRDARYNLCVSSEGGVAHLRIRAQAFFERFAGAAVYHLWADDIRGGGWCECPDCAGMSPSDQALFATNVLADVLAESAPGARIAHLAYHDTLLPPTNVRPRENVSLLFAPRERCYAHAINDASCERNVPQYWAPFEGLLPLFANDPARIDVFEYYSDAILFKWLAPPLLSVQPLDAEAYQSAGAGNLQNLMVTPRRWLGPPWHTWWMARCAWGSAAGVDAALGEFCGAAYPGHSREMADYYREQERAYRLILDLHDLKPTPRRDVLDFSDQPAETLRTKVGELSEAAALFEDLYERILGFGGGELAGEAEQAELVWHVVAHLAGRTAAWELLLRGDNSKSGARHIAAASVHLGWLDEWERSANSPAYANLSRGMLSGMRSFTRALA